jgi:hypothetical protein
MENISLLTKSDFLLFLEAPRHLWAEKHGLIDKTPSVFDINVMRQGYEVEAFAKEFLVKSVLKLKGEVDELRFITLETLAKPSQEVAQPCLTIGLSHN